MTPLELCLGIQNANFSQDTQFSPNEKLNEQAMCLLEFVEKVFKLGFAEMPDYDDLCRIL